ncbi:MAG: ATP-binding cassette domain-containing protein, partial [Rhodobacteraceae bacterium]|nr:ATP-binding cassette domain-containing protein [Paracoccaceae bacterium]
RIVHAVDGVSLRVDLGETLGIVGESGCGKSTLARMMLGLEPPTSGVMRVSGTDLRALDAGQRRRYRREVQAVFQDPYSSLNPRMRIASTLTEPLVVHRLYSANERRDRARAILERVGLPDDTLSRYPHEFSGGQRQRIAIARALILEPKLIVLDEPISALDVSIRAQVLNILADLRDAFGTGYVFIAHDLAAVATISDRIAVMYLGRIVEIGAAKDVAHDPAHPYTRMLFAAADPTAGTLPPQGEPPSPITPPAGCHFHSRCPFARPDCAAQAPALREVHGRLAACHYAESL